MYILQLDLGPTTFTHIENTYYYWFRASLISLKEREGEKKENLGTQINVNSRNFFGYNSRYLKLPVRLDF